MKEKLTKEAKELRLRYWAILLNPVFLGIYFYGMQTLYKLCKYGGLRRRAPIILLCGAIGIAWLVIFSRVYFLKKKKGEEKTNSKKKPLLAVFCTELLIFCGITIFFGAQIVHSGTKYNGKLSWVVDHLLRDKKIELIHNNIYEDGIEGIFEDLERKIDIPDELYLINRFSVGFDQDGTITSIYSYFYGKDEQGKTRRFLLSYDRDKSEEMTVTLEEGSGGEYPETEKLDSLFAIMELVDVKKEVSLWSDSYGVNEFALLYYGHRSFPTDEGIRVVKQDGSYGDPKEVKTREGYTGYEVSLYVPDREDIVPVRYVDGWNILTIEEDEPEYTYASGKSTVNPEDGLIYYFLNEQKGWRLAILDAALGSRWYALEVTGDGGKTWEAVTPDPFPEVLFGVAEGIEFYDEQLGFVLMGGASETHSELYMTTDGGNSFTRVQPPTNKIVGEVTNASGYIYISMPVKEGNVFKLELRREKYDSSRIYYESSDNGKTWVCVGSRAE
ncbi:MAG: exo-alpha-sialidase [Lachnospiraceae bacterium]|nr:exo-alpha-sialidase [Lachnospiraceae bacterium]